MALILNQWETLSDQIVVACGAQSMCMAICHDAMAMDMATDTAIAMGSGVYGAAKSLVFMQSVGNLHGGWWWRCVSLIEAGYGELGLSDS
ncbi:MAG: hypothetical protein SOV16_07240 [Anaerobiospirillum succiniciproducens]|nr:hypothetical protein [Anaerobiospirillum succiniciproducens]